MDEPKDGGNGKLEAEPIKTEEQLKQERLDRYTKAPDTFVEIDELICAVIRNPKSQLGISVMLGNAKRSEIDLAWAELNHRISFSLRQMDIAAEMKNHPKIIPAKHGMLDGARKIFGRR